MKQRLIELINAKQDAGIYETPGFQPTGCTSNEELADHLLANGVVAPPIKIGDTVWAMHGEWGNPLFIDGVWLFPCSNCHYSTVSRSKDFKPCFCSNCGAKMDAERKEQS